MSASDSGLLLLSLIWGGSFFLIALIGVHRPILCVVALRVMIAAAVLWAIMLAMPRGVGLWGAFPIMGVLNAVMIGVDELAGHGHGVLSQQGAAISYVGPRPSACGSARRVSIRW